MQVDLYEILGLSPQATPAEIKAAYRAAAPETHPDRAPEGRRHVYEVRFKQVTEAYQVLSDPVRRAAYDRGEDEAEDEDEAEAPPASPLREGLSRVFAVAKGAARQAAEETAIVMVEEAQGLGKDVIRLGAQRLRERLFRRGR